LHDPEIEKTARANRRAVRLARSVEGISRNSSPLLIHPTETEPITMEDHQGDTPPPPLARPMMGDYGLTT